MWGESHMDSKRCRAASGILSSAYYCHCGSYISASDRDSRHFEGVSAAGYSISGSADICRRTVEKYKT
jgi:hypothetical protein